MLEEHEAATETKDEYLAGMARSLGVIFCAKDSWLERTKTWEYQSTLRIFIASPGRSWLVDVKQTLLLSFELKRAVDRRGGTATARSRHKLELPMAHERGVCPFAQISGQPDCNLRS